MYKIRTRKRMNKNIGWGESFDDAIEESKLFDLLQKGNTIVLEPSEGTLNSHGHSDCLVNIIYSFGAVVTTKFLKIY